DRYLSLREAIAIVNSPSLPNDLSPEILAQISGTLHAGGTDTIGFDAAAVTGPIVLSSTQPNLLLTGSPASVTIDGGTRGVTVDGNNARTILGVGDPRQVTLDHLTLTHANSRFFPGGGAILNRGTLTVANCTLTGNTSSSDGGAITNESTGVLTVLDS